jgi:hypothetical protein
LGLRIKERKPTEIKDEGSSMKQLMLRKMKKVLATDKLLIGRTRGSMLARELTVPIL